MTVTSTRKEADLAGPGMGDYGELAAVLPTDYRPLLTPRETMQALYEAKRFLEDRLCADLGLMQVQVPLIVDTHSGVNDGLDRDGSRSPVRFHVANDGAHALDAEVVQAATKWKRLALREFGLGPGEGLLTDMRAIRKDYFLDHDHSVYVDQWDWEKAILPEQRTLPYLFDTVRTIWRTLVAAEAMLLERYPQLDDGRYPRLPDELEIVDAADVLAAYPELPRKARETKLLQEHPAVFIHGIGWPLADGYPHELRAADYDDWTLNGDILVWNAVTRRRHELMSGGIRVDRETLVRQLEHAGQLDLLRLPYHQAILRDEVPLSIGAGIGQSRTMMLLLRKAHLGEVSVTVWPPILRDLCAERNIHVLT